MGLKAQNFDLKEQYRSGEGESQCLMESYMQNLRQSELLGLVGSSPKFGYRVWTGLTAWNIEQKDWYQLGEDKLQCKMG